MTIQRDRYGQIEFVVVVPPETDMHRCEYARQEIQKQPEITEQLAESLAIRAMLPVFNEGDGEQYKCKANIIWDEQ